KTGSTEEQAIFWTCVVLLSGVEAPYGRYNQGGGAEQSGVLKAVTQYNMDAKLAWILQECPTLVAAAICWFLGDEVCTS
ncbi:unnamed protein product, partial [Polarella glacialis]